VSIPLKGIAAKTGMTAAAAALAFGTFGVFGASAASAATPDGAAALTTSGGTVLPGPNGSRQAFTVTLPPQASCFANSATGGARVQSYLVPAGTDVSTLNWLTGPPANLVGLFNGTPSYYGGQLTALSGQIIQIPFDLELSAGNNFNASTFTPGSKWEAGIACTDGTGAVRNFWNVELTMAASTNDPNGFTWTQPNPNPPVVPEVPLALGLPIGGAAVLAAGVFINRRRAVRKAVAPVA